MRAVRVWVGACGSAKFGRVALNLLGHVRVRVRVHVLVLVRAGVRSCARAGDGIRTFRRSPQ